MGKKRKATYHPQHNEATKRPKYDMKGKLETKPKDTTPKQSHLNHSQPVRKNSNAKQSPIEITTISLNDFKIDVTNPSAIDSTHQSF
jgi:hypothetical protein